MIKVAILIQLCSRNQKWNNIDEIDFIKIFLPSFHRTKEEDYRYIFYLGIDDNDTFFNRYREDLEYKLGYKDRIIILEGCNHNPARAWNILYRGVPLPLKALDFYFERYKDKRQFCFNGFTSAT